MASAASPPPQRPPENRVSQIIDDALERFSPPESSLLAGAMPQEASEPLRLYTIALGSLSDREGPVRFYQIGWRSLLVSPLGGTRSADVSGVDNLSFGHFARGPAVDRLISAGARLEEYLGDAGDEKADIIESDALRIGAIANQAHDLFVPYLGLPEDVMSLSTFEEAIRRKAAAIWGSA